MPSFPRLRSVSFDESSEVHFCAIESSAVEVEKLGGSLGEIIAIDCPTIPNDAFVVSKAYSLSSLGNILLVAALTF